MDKWIILALFYAVAASFYWLGRQCGRDEIGRLKAKAQFLRNKLSGYRDEEMK